MEDFKLKVNAKGDGERLSTKFNAQEFNGIAQSLMTILSSVGVGFSDLDSQGNVVNTDLLTQAIYKLNNVNNFFTQQNSEANNIVLTPSVATSKYTNQFYAGYLFKFVATEDYVVGQNVLIRPQNAKLLVDNNGKILTTLAWKKNHLVELLFDGDKYRLISSSYYHEIKQAELEIGTILTPQGKPNFVSAFGEALIGRKQYILPAGQTIANGVSKYPKYVEYLLKQEPHLKNIIQGNNLIMPDWVNKYFRLFADRSDVKVGDSFLQSLPAIVGFGATIPQLSRAGGTVEERGVFSNLTGAIRYETPPVIDNLRIRVFEDTTISQLAENIFYSPTYDRVMTIGDVHPNSVSVLPLIHVGVDYDY